MPRGKPTPDYKFRLLCRRCNSYLHTFVQVEGEGELVMGCHQCNVIAHDIDEARGYLQPEENW